MSSEEKPSQRAAYSDLFEKLLDPLFLLNPEDFTIWEMNPAAERFLGDRHAEWIGKSLLGMAVSEDVENLEKSFRIAMRRHHPRQFESPWLPATKGLAPRHMEVSAGRLDLAGGGSALQVIARDISEKKKLLEALKDLSLRDPMTGMRNYRYFAQQIQHEHERAKRYKSNYAVVFCDLDNFKHYNDRNGHPAGDDLLRELSQIIQSCCRTSDVPARYGGEEFVVLCPNVTHLQAKVLADRIRERVAAAALPFADAQPLKCVSFSVGVSGFPDHGQTHEEVVHAADEAMYYSKTHGKNQVTVASPETQALKKSA